jgi:hypothetical protein
MKSEVRNNLVLQNVVNERGVHHSGFGCTKICVILRNCLNYMRLDALKICVLLASCAKIFLVVKPLVNDSTVSN